MAPKFCKHPTPSSLHDVLPASVLICPTCLIKHHIGEIKKTQAALQQRGGIFASKTKKPTSERPWGSRQSVSHKEWMRRWRLTKMGVYNDVERFEKLKMEYPEKVAEWGIETALAIWKETEERCCRVPGYQYTDGEGSESEWKTATPKSEWKTATPKSRRRASQTTTSTSQPSRIDSPVMDHSIPWPNNGLCSHLPGLKDVLLQEMETATHRLELCAEPSPKDKPNDHSHKSTPLTPKPAAQKGTTLPPPTPTSNPTPRSALKRSGSSPTPTPGPPRTININPLVTVLSDLDTIPINSPNPTLQPHNEHTLSEKRKHISIYNRNSPSYTPATWASPEGYEKTNTSHFKTAWEVFECIQRAYDDGEADIESTPPDDEKEGEVVEEQSSMAQKLPEVIEDIAALVLETKPSSPGKTSEVLDQRPSAPTKKPAVFDHQSEETVSWTEPSGARCGTTIGVGERESER